MTTESILRVEEGKSLKLYKDSLGVATIGVGYAIGLRGLPDDIVEELFRRDLIELRIQAAKIPEYDALDLVRRGVLERMVFQLGFEDVMDFHDMRAALARQDWATAAAEMLDSKWQQQTPARCRRESDRMRRGIE